MDAISNPPAGLDPLLPFMKTLLVLILFCTSLYGAVTTTTNNVGDITTKITERLGEAGKPDFRFETVYRGKTIVLQILSRRNKQGAMAIVSRGYFVDGKHHMDETDEDGDGFFESITVINPVTGDFEKFTRLADGSVKPMSTEALEAIMKKLEVADELLRKLLHEASEKE